MEQVMAKINRLKQLKGKEKEEYLERCLIDEVFISVCELALDTSKSFGVKTIKKRSHEAEDDNIIALLQKMSKIKGNATKKEKHWLECVASQTDATFEVTRKILRGKLDCNVGTKKVHELAPNLVPYFPYMRCRGVSDLDKFKLKEDEWFYSQLKDNGMYVDIIVSIEDMTVTYQTRNGNKLKIVLPIDQKLLNYVPESYVLMGELTLLFPETQQTMPRAAGNAIIANAIDEQMPVDIYPRLRINIWDAVPFRDYIVHICTEPYAERFNGLFDFMTSAGVTLFMNPIETRIVSSIDEAWEHYYEIRERKVGDREDQLEGTVIKKADGIWKDSGSSGVLWQIKLKAEKECELIVVDFKPGLEGSKYDNMIGSLILEDLNGDLRTASSGMDDSVRGRDPDTLMGEIWTVRFNAISKNKNKKTVALDNPRLIEPRPDKKHADDLNYIRNVKSVR